MDESNFLNPAPRFVIAQSWWLASELARRNDLEVYEMHPADGMYDILAVGRITQDGFGGEHLKMNREGSLHLFPDRIGWMKWGEVFSAEDPHDIVHRIEAALNLRPMYKPITKPRTLTYRLIARVLTSLVDDRHRWDARMGFLDTSGYGGGPRHQVDELFPNALDHVQHLPNLPPWSRRRHLWILGYDIDSPKPHPIAVLSDDANLFLPGKKGTVDLMDRYNANGRHLNATIHAALGRLLP